MRKITLIAILLSVSNIFAQVFPVDFSDPLDDMFGDDCTFTLTTDAGNDVGLITGGGTLFDNVQLALSENLDLSDDANNTITFRIKPEEDYGTRTHLLKFENGTAANSELGFTTTGDAWQDISLDYPGGLGNYGLLVLFTDFNNTAIGNYLIDDFEGGTNITPIPDPEPAPIPNAPDGETYSIYNDTNGYTTTFPYVYSFGTLGGEPDLDLGTGINKALKFDFTFAGYGEGEGGPDDVSAYNFVNFMYWAEPGIPGFQFRMISNNGGVEEYPYEIGTNEAVVTGSWTQVSIPMSYFTGLGFSSAHLFQWKFETFMQVVTDPGIVYVDNIILTQNPLSVNGFETAQFRVFPNPTNGNWNISSRTIINTIAVYDILGKQVLTFAPNTITTIIDASSLKSGMYFAKIQGVSGSSTVKLIKE